MNNVKLRIDTRYFRMCIHRQALKIIGDPPFLIFGYDPGSTRLAVIGTRIDDRKSFRVRYDSSGSVYIHSKSLILGIREVSQIFIEEGSYLVDGEVWKTRGMLVFPLRNASRQNKTDRYYPSDGANVPRGNVDNYHIPKYTEGKTEG